MPPKWLHLYDDFITKNAHQVSQIESTLRSLTYIIPGRFRDAEIASESIHSGVQLLSLYHDTLLRRRAHALSSSKVPPPPPHASSSSPSSTLQPPPTPHARYTRHWTLRSALYRRVAYLLQVVQYVQLLCEMGARRRGASEQTRWRAVVVLEALKALCRLLLLRITRSRPVVTPVLPEREPIPEEEEGDGDGEGGEGFGEEVGEEDDEERGAARLAGDANGSAVVMNGSAQQPNGSISAYSRRAPNQQHQQHKLGPNGEWTMPRTGMKLPTLPLPGDTGGFLQARVLTADDIKPAPRLLNRLRGAQAHAAEVLHILAPLVFALALARTPEKDRRRAWTPWLLGVGVEVAARQLRDQGLRTTPLEREEWSRRGWAMGWWAMRGAFYQHVTKGVVAGVRRRVPGLVAGILEDYEYLWENYYFSTAD